MAPTQKRMLRSSKSTKALTTLLKDVTPEEPPPTEVVTVEDDEGDTGVTYFMDENGCYYYQKGQNIISLPTATVEDNVTFELPVQEDVGTAPTQVEMSEQESYQTLTLVPSKGANGEVSYVLVVQDETKPMNNVNDIKPKILNDVYNFKDDEDQKDNIEIEINDAGTPAPKKTRNHNKTGFTCNICNYTSHRRYLLVRHLKSHSEERPLKCRVCERGFKTAASLQNHTNMHNGVKPHLCKYCHVAFTTSGELVRHVRYKHTHEKPHKCTECDYASVELSKLRRHVRCHTGERPYQCPHCTYASPDTFKLKRHIRTHTGEKPYKCDMCNMCFSQSNSLKAHKLIHNVADKPVYACELCPAKCGRKTDLRIHVQKLHTSDKPLKCKRCGKTFPDRYSCKMHNKTHEGEKCYKCDLCPYASTALRHLNSHILKHTDEKPYACDDCDQSFRQKQLLRRHQNLYHNPNYVPKPPREKTHTCHECNRCFAHKGNLIRHLEIHDPESGHQERALALKLGRQKKVRYTDSESLKGMHLNSGGGQMLKLDSGDLKQGELVSVDDSQQYVVIEVIQLEDGSEQQVAVVAPDYLAMRDKDNIIQMEGIVEDDDEEDEGNEEEEQEEDMETKMAINIQNQEKAAAERSIKLERDVNTCFGFEEDDEDDEVYEEQKVIFELV